MTPLAPLGGSATSARAPPTSALAAFASKTLGGGSAMPPSASAGAALKPLTSAARPLDGATARGRAAVQTRNALPLSPVAQQQPTGEVSALAAFAKKAALLPPTSGTPSPLDRLPSGSMPKRPPPLTLASMGAPHSADSKETKDAEVSLVAGGEEKKEAHSELKGDGPRADSSPKSSDAADTAPTEKETTSESKLINVFDDSSGSDDGMAEFACMESEDDDGEAEGRGVMDVDDLYDHDGAEHDNEAVLRAKERMFVPPTSNHDLLHAILIEDVNLLTHTLSHMTPQDALEIRDAEHRKMYHYAALSKSAEIQAVVFDFVSCYLMQDSDHRKATIEGKKVRLDRWKGYDQRSPNRSDWEPPRMKEIQASVEYDLADAYLSLLRNYDCNGRSFLHYSTLNHHCSPITASRVLARTLKSHSDELLHKDVFGRDPLTYAVMMDNARAITLWFTELGLGEVLTTGDVDRLVQLQMTSSMQRLLYNLLEHRDSAQLSRKQTSKQANFGLSVQFLTKSRNLSGASTKSAAAAGTRMWTSLHKAVVYGNVDAVRCFIDQDAHIDERDADGWTPLHHCAAQGHTINAHMEIAEILLECGADVNATSLHGRTPLHLVAMHFAEDVDSFSAIATSDSSPSPCVAFAMLLCARGARLNIRDEDQCTPLLIAVRAGNVRLARFLLESNCDPLAVDKTGGCALHIAVAHGLEEMARFLCWWDAQYPSWRLMKDFQGRLPIALAKGGDTLRHSLDNLWYTVRLANADQVCQQLRLYRSMSKRERSREISIHSKTPFTQRTALHLTIEPFLESSKLDVKKTAQKNHGVATSCRIQETKLIVGALLEEGASIGIGDKWAITPLMLAATIDSPLLVEVMLKFATEEDLKQTDSCGNTAVHYSYAFSRAKISSLLEEATEDADTENKDGRGPLAVTGYREKIFPSEYRAFLKTQHRAQPIRAASEHTRK